MQTQITLVAFGIKEHTLCVFLENTKLPSIQLEEKNDLEEAVRKLSQQYLQTSLDQHYFEQLYTVTNNGIISIVYFILIENPRGENWYPTNTLQIHEIDKEIISYAVQRLRWKIEYTNVVYSLLPNEFTLSELQKTYEAILDKELDKRNFRKKMLSVDFLEDIGKKKISIARPAELYKFKQKIPVMVKLFS